MEFNCRIEIDGTSPRPAGLAKARLKKAAKFFAARSSARVRIPFREVAVILQDDAFSAETHSAINGAEGPTDVTTQRYEAIPPEPEGVYGELYVNVDMAVRSAPKRRGWSAAKELLLYVAHGMDHLSGADDSDPADYDRMRRRELAWLKEGDFA
ncbi:MAG: rRNA maturation RNase YbeY [Kiritimatiellae bacterium]|nr:rRNA maturation RNase YbeY [Kiritimatiellia bacterium]